MFQRFALVFLAATTAAFAQTQTAPLPMISAPVTGPGAMFPGLREVPTGTGLADHKYVVTEYFVSGTASGKPYTTRILVRKPDNSSRFSGIVVAEPMHASGNSWMFYFTRIYMMRHGHISVEIAPQKAGTEDTVVKSNPQRYAAISLPDMGQANEIMAQVGALLKGNGRTSPLTGLRVRRLVMMGTSQSAGTLRGYLPAHAGWRMPDGKPIFDGFLATSTAGMPIPKVDVPLIQIATQTEVNNGAAKGSAYRRADGDAAGDQFRLYEIAGMPHNDSRESPTYDPDPCKLPVTRFPVGAMMAMALHHTIEWADKGTVPPRAERIAVENGAVAFDENGNAKGGVRNTYVDVPVAKYGVPNNADPKPGTRDDFYCGIAGYETPLEADRLHALHTNAATYRRKVAQRLDELTKAGWFRPEYRDQVIGDAEQVRIAANPAQSSAALPDWSGVWQMVGGTVFDRATASGQGGALTHGLRQRPPYNSEWEAIYQRNLKLRDENRLPDPINTCGTPAGFPRVMNLPDMYEFVVRPEQTWILTENGPNVLRIYTDGRPHPAPDDRWPTYTGDSVGKWEGDTLVFTTLSTKNSQWPTSGDTVLDRTGLVLSDAAHVTTRLRRVDDQTMEARMVIEDPKALTAPWHVTKTYRKAEKGTRVYDYGCAENNRNPVDEATGKTLILGPDGKTFGK
jgi:Alpha/beta hydrolase domain